MDPRSAGTSSRLPEGKLRPTCPGRKVPGTTGTRQAEIAHVAKPKPAATRELSISSGCSCPGNGEASRPQKGAHSAANPPRGRDLSAKPGAPSKQPVPGATSLWKNLHHHRARKALIFNRNHTKQSHLEASRHRTNCRKEARWSWAQPVCPLPPPASQTRFLAVEHSAIFY